MFVTARTTTDLGLVEELAEALGALGVEARADQETLVVDGARLVPALVARAHPTPADLTAIIGERGGRSPALVVADRISEAGRDVLRRAGWGWLDRRGHVRVWAPGVRVESALPRPDGSIARRAPADPWTTAGLEVALSALLAPEEPVTARRVASRTGRSPGTVHELIGRYAELGLIGPKTHRPLLPELFWETAARWPDDGWTALPVELAQVAEVVGHEELVRVDERAATLGGARLAAVGDLPGRAYLTSPGALRRARALAERGAPARSWVREAPVRWLPRNEEHPPDAAHPWHVAHPIVCALRLAADPARGREIVEAWGIVPGEA